MAIVRHEERSKYLRIDNDSLRDPRLSFRATGLLAWGLSMPDGWVLKSEHLASLKPEGRDAIRSAMKELQDNGYLVVERYQDERGQWRYDSTLYERPIGGWPQTGDAVGGIPKSENPVGACPTPGSQAVSITKDELQSTNNPMNNNSRAITEEEATFLEGKGEQSKNNGVEGAQKGRGSLPDIPLTIEAHANDETWGKYIRKVFDSETELERFELGLIDELLTLLLVDCGIPAKSLAAHGVSASAFRSSVLNDRPDQQELATRIEDLREALV